MIRHSSSFFISLILHLLLALIIFYGYKQVTKVKQTSYEEKVKIYLCSLPEAKAIPKPLPKIKKVVKKEPIVKKVIPKKTIKPKPIKKVKKIKKKVIVKKTVPVKKAPKIPEPQKIEPIPEVVEPVQIEEVIQEPIQEEVQQIIPEVQTEVSPPAQEELQETTENKVLRLEQEYINEHIQKISKLLSENLYYPRSARKRNIQGKVMVKFKLSTSSKSYDIQVISSKSEILSRAAIKTIEDLSGKFPSPPEELVLHVPINYGLTK